MWSKNIFAAENLDGIYQEAALNFFNAQYREKQIEYDNISVALEANLYNDQEEVVAKAIVLSTRAEIL